MKKGFIFVLFFVVTVSLVMITSELSADSPKESNNEQITTAPLNVVLVSSKILNAKAIADASKDMAISIVYDFKNTDLNQINLTLEEMVEWKKQKIDHLVLVCHGAPGNILISSNQVVDFKSLNKVSEELKVMGNLMQPDAKIDFYGSEIGWGEEGSRLVKAISYLTGSDVGASDDPSGNIHDADWELEVKTGISSFNSPINFSQLVKTPIYF